MCTFLGTWKVRICGLSLLLLRSTGTWSLPMRPSSRSQLGRSGSTDEGGFTGGNKLGAIRNSGHNEGKLAHRVQLDCQNGLRAQKAYHIWFLGPNSILVASLSPFGSLLPA